MFSIYSALTITGAAGFVVCGEVYRKSIFLCLLVAATVPVACFFSLLFPIRSLSHSCLYLISILIMD